MVRFSSRFFLKGRPSRNDASLIPVGAGNPESNRYLRLNCDSRFSLPDTKKDRSRDNRTGGSRWLRQSSGRALVAAVTAAGETREPEIKIDIDGY
jgi:hypothetical protein